MENLKNAQLENVSDESSQAKSKGSTKPKKKRKKVYKPLQEFIHDSQKTLINAQDSEILPLLEKRGYPKALILDKQKQFDDLDKLDQDQKKEYGEQYDATEAYNKKVELLDEEYADHLTFGRRLFKNDAAAKSALGLKGIRSASESGYAKQGKLFYDGALDNADYIAAFAKKGVTDTELKAQQSGFNDLVVLSANKDDESAEAQKATKDRDALYDELNEWMAEFKETAIIALKKFPQLREKLGYIEE